MAIELFSNDSSGIMTPRISFSHDIAQINTVPVEQYIQSNSSSSTIGFDFCVSHQSFDLEPSSADELFFDGKILPIEMKRQNTNPTFPSNKAKLKQVAKSHKLVTANNTSFKNENLIETKTESILELSSSSSSSSSSISSEDQKQNNSKSFWKIKRSSSLNCGSNYARSLCPLTLLSRSNSTPSVKRSKDSSSNKQHSQKISTGYYQKPPLKKVPSNPYSNGIKINSVLNVPPASLFGLSSIFSSGKEKNKK